MTFSIANILIDSNDYDIGNVLGKGGFGIVFLARDKKHDNREVALKIIQNMTATADRKEQQNILREIYVPSYLNLPGIVKLLGFRFPLTETQKKDKSTKLPLKEIVGPSGKKEKVDFSGSIMVTELMKNGSLEKITDEYIRTGGKSKLLNPTVRSKILFGVAATMKRVHACNVLHRDLKLENVFLDENIEPRIADFGLAKVAVSGIDMTMALGTPLYMAPEIFMDGDETYTEKVDVYAYAFLIYKSFTDKLEFEGKKPIRSAQQFMMNIGRGKRPRNSDLIPEVYWDLIQKCWNQQADQRPSFAEITQMLRSDKYAIEEYGMKTDLAQLHEYWERIDPPTEDKPPEFSKSLFVSENLGGKSIKLKQTTSNPLFKKRVHKTKFNWKRH